MTRHRLACSVFAAASILLAAGAASAQDQAFSFGLWGDLPYAKSNDLPKIKGLIDDMNASDIAFAMFDGDIKDGSSKCDDQVFTDAIAMFNAFKMPSVYVPGDNEWTDCHRTNNGGYDNLERLDHMRKVMFADPQSFGGQKMAMDHQAAPGEKFSENTRFVHGNIVFVGLNIPGSNNNKVNDDKTCTAKSARTKAQCDADNKEYAERDSANVAWMHQAFALAKTQKSPGIVLVFQADPWFDLPETEDKNERDDPNSDGYTNFLKAVVDEAKAYDGQVLLVHGDTHFFKLDHPLLDQAHMIENITRLETFGSPNAHWVKVTVDPRYREVFLVQPMIVKGN
ncbi:MAG TPA: hypothetical protein VMW18_01185 [Candidatus Binatia bacterium]|nr:hypothetical protein [Candidatus Binatia bacterium]